MSATQGEEGRGTSAGPNYTNSWELEIDTLVNKFIEKWLPESYAHLIDNDDNDGERLRQELRMELTKAHLEGAANYVTTVYGERCEAKDTDEFPGIDKDPKATRCLVCREWEYYDEWASSLTAQLKEKE